MIKSAREKMEFQVPKEYHDCVCFCNCDGENDSEGIELLNIASSLYDRIHNYYINVNLNK